MISLLRLPSLTLLLLAATNAIAAVDFESEIQPIFAEKCTLCHGPDDAHGGLRLTGLETATQALDSGKYAIVPKHSEKSEIIARIHHADPDELMPPPGKAEPLTDKEKSLLAQWINEGADWPRHWAYTPLKETAPSPHENYKHPIDRFIATSLEREGIEASPTAKPITLIRRLYYDLIGLPPSIEDTERYLTLISKDRDSGVEQLVDDLLASKHFGERWGRHWLDIARYADSDGYEKDNNRPDAWRYRDWVIEAINRDLPIDQFTIEQFAGDLLDNADQDQRLATAFNRQTLTNTEGGTDQEQWRVAAVMDRVETMGAAWMGLTLTCARCHTHKYDEITHHEYYSLFAYFNNGDEGTTKVPTSHQEWADYERALKEHEAKHRDLRKRHAQARSGLLSDEILAKTQQAFKEASASQTPAEIDPSITKVTGPSDVAFTAGDDGSYTATGANSDKATYTISGTLPSANITGLVVELLPQTKGGKVGRGENGNIVLNHVQLTVSDETQVFADAEADHSQRGWPIRDALDPKAEDGTKGNGWAISPEMHQSHKATFGLAEPLRLADSSPFEIKLIQHYGKQHTIGRFRIRFLTSPTLLAWSPAARKALKDGQISGEAEQAVLLDHLASFHPEARELSLAMKAAEASAPKKPEMTVRVLLERNKDRRKTHVFRRGEFKQPTDEVTPGALASLPPVEHREGSQGDRLDLARWLVSGENPLPPRVLVNQIWAHLFGEGLVTTLNDFGVRGERPSHPHLLDWLARELIDMNWSRKQLIKTIVLSKTYQRSSDHRPDLLEKDPKNRWLARQNRFRVEAEIVRDLSLSVADLLSHELGGPSVFPPIPAGVSDVNYNSAFKWEVSPGSNRYRRGLYTYFKRTAPHPNLITFDCPDSNVTCVKRTRSNTPLAALITLNNSTFTEAAQALAKRVSSKQEPLLIAFRHCLSRHPEPNELGKLHALREKAQAYYKDHPDEAAKLSPGAPELADLTATVRVLLNLDEFLTRN